MYRVPATLPRWLGAAALAMAVGCSDPSTSVLAAGATVILSDGTDAPVRAWVVRTVADRPGAEERLDLPARTRAVVVKDQAVEAPKEPSYRLTRVRILDGPHAGAEVEIGRYKLRPPG